MAIIITLIAGLSTVIGALLVSHVRKNSFEAISLAFATGIMLMIGIGELLPEAMIALNVPLTMILFIIGALLSLILDLIIPHHHEHEVDEALEEPGHFIDDCECNHQKSVSRGMIVALILHNLIEGIAMGLTAVSDMRLGISMAIGIALHNIPIGATLAISIKAAGEKQTRAVWASVFVGLSQPLGSLAGLLLFKGPNMEGVLSALMAVVAGILVFISFDELWPAARLNGSRKTTIIALLAGICFIPVAEMLI